MIGQEPESGSPQPVLRVEGVSKAFRGTQALQDLSLDVPHGAICTVVGPKGAGKTTLIDIITGVYSPDEGRIFYGECQIHGAKTHDLVNKGIARTFQNVELFGGLTVIENVLVGRHTRMRYGIWGAIARWPWVLAEEKNARSRAEELLRFVGLDGVADQRSTHLPFGLQRFLEIARALASEPRMLLLDEPSSGLSTVEKQRLGDLLKEMRSHGITLLIVEHDMSLTKAISEKMVVLHQGKKLAEGTPEEIQHNDLVISAYLE